ncbi:MAG: hypothetical protein ACQESR_01330 [Planctomycetota bacterium]
MKSTTTRFAVGFVLAAVGLSWVSGCSNGVDRLPVYPVSGTVTQNGEPVADAQVAFVPVGEGEGEDKGKTATGNTASDGTYELTTYSAGDGAAAGNYKVKITKISRPPGGDAPPAESGDESVDLTEDESYAPPSAGGGEPDWTPENLLPEKYADPDESGFTATVEPEGDNTFDFSLE